LKNKKATILIVDDTYSNIDILLEFLKEYDLIVATSGEEALDIVNTGEKIDLILLDIMMPKMDGFEVCKILKKDPIHSTIPIIFLTAKLDDKSIEKAFEIGGVDYIGKPFRPIELFSRIKTHLKLLEQQKELAFKKKHNAVKDLIGNIAHQWKQPLSVITTSVSGMMVQKELNALDDESFFQFCKTALDSCEYLNNTIEQFNIFLQVKEKKNHTLYNLITENNFLFMYNNEKIEFITQIDPSIECFCSSMDILHILQVIINNAKNIMQEQDEKLILIAAEMKEELLILKVCDSGGGISSSIIDNIFDPYFTTEHQSLGKGLNLFKIYSLVTNSLGGEISVQNKEFEVNNKKYKGACFEISFPCYN
jgi:CheY-like chemotaxis protein